MINLEKTSDDAAVLTLRKPITLGPNTYVTLNLQEPTASQIEKSFQASNGVSGNIQLISLVSKVPVAAISAMGARDYREATEYLRSFFEDGPQSGETLSAD